MKTNFKKIIIAIVLCILFIIIVSSTVRFTFFTLDDIRLLLILLSCTGILVLISNTEFKDTKKLLGRIRFNLFLTAMIMSVLLFFETFTKPSQGLGFRLLLLSSFKPLLLAMIAYLPILNMVERNYVYINEINNADEVGEVLTYPDLTRREREVFDLALYDLSNKEIAEKLFIAETTVKKHMQNILKKIECSNREQLIEKYNKLLVGDQN